jgi:cell division protein FtsL
VDVPEVTFEWAGLLVIILVAAVLCGGAIAVSKYNVQIKAFLEKLLAKKEEDEVEVEFYEMESEETAESVEESTEVEKDETKN